MQKWPNSYNTTMTTRAETAIRLSNEQNMFSTKPSSLQSITEGYISLIYAEHSSFFALLSIPLTLSLG